MPVVVDENQHHNDIVHDEDIQLTRTQEFGNSLKLNVVCTFVDGTDLGVSPVLFKTNLSNESLAARPLDGRSGRLLRDNRCIVLRHGGFLCERPSFLLQTEGVSLNNSVRKVLTCLESRGIVSQESCCFNLSSHFCELETHSLELSNGLSKLLALISILETLIKSSLGKTDHLGCNADTSFVEDLNRNL